MRESHHPRERTQCPDQIQTLREQHPPQSRVLLPYRMRDSHNPRERTQCPDQIQAPREQHPPQSEVPNLNRFPVSAETPHVRLFWDVCPDSPNRSRDTPWQSHQSSQKQQGLPTSDTADAFDITRDGNQHSFYQVIILCICAAEVYRCYAPIKRVVPLLHSIITPVKTPSQQGRSTSIHSTGNTARWGARRPAMSGVPGSNVPGPRCTPGSPHSRR